MMQIALPSRPPRTFHVRMHAQSFLRRHTCAAVPPQLPTQVAHACLCVHHLRSLSIAPSLFFLSAQNGENRAPFFCFAQLRNCSQVLVQCGRRECLEGKRWRLPHTGSQLARRLRKLHIGLFINHVRLSKGKHSRGETQTL